MNQVQLSPMERYQRDIRENEYSFDEAQNQAIAKLDSLYHELVKRRKKPASFFKKLFSGSPTTVKGLYMWGGVGRGKTYLMDSFYDALPFKQKKRLHFHRFMYWVHEELKKLDGQPDPLKSIARQLAKESNILCFDEFFVSDIGDAMILATLMEEIFKLGVCLVCTSNIVPDELYRNGLQRARFLPAIELIKQHTEVLNVDGGIDYRLRTLEQAEIYHSPLDKAADDNLEFSFTHLAVDEIHRNSFICINHREITVKALADGVIWFDFKAVCQSARSARDYIELSRLYHSILLSDVPQLTDDANDDARRFISLVDELYERNVKLIISAEVPLEELYNGKGLAFEFKRTISRLQEMQSHSYLAKQHLP